MVTDKSIKKAIAFGREKAEEAVKFRDQELIKRAEALRPQELRRLITATAARRKPTRRVTPAMKRKLGRPAKAVLIAEGDSWFDYPRYHILRILEDHHGYDVESVAHKGDRVENMAYGKGQLEEFARCIEKVLRRGIIPKAILLSGGGNDIAGKEFGMLLNHAESAIPGLNNGVVEGVIDERLMLAYVTIISEVTEVCEKRIGHRLPILVHGYDYPVPDGRGFLGGWWFLPGPWLEPGFREKGFDELSKRVELAEELITKFNVMLEKVTSLPKFKHVRYIDLQGTLSVDLVDNKYRDDWANELHPTEKGFNRITDKFDQVLDALPQQ